MTVVTAAVAVSASLSLGTAAATRTDLETAQSGLSAAQERLEAAQQDLDRIDERIAAAALELRATEAALAFVRGDRNDAVAAQLEAAEALADTTAALQSAEEETATSTSLLTTQVRTTWARGPVAAAAVQLRVFLGAADVHDALTAQRGLDRLLTDAGRRRRAADDAQRVAIAARTAPTEVIDDARRAVFNAHSDLTQLARLEQAQQVALASLAREQDARREVLARLAVDRDALAVLVDRLRFAVLGVSIEGALTPPVVLPLDGPAPAWSAGLPPRGQAWSPIVNAMAARNGLDGALLAALVWSESGFNPAVVSHAGAIGMSQLMPGTAAGLGVDPWDPAANLDGGARYLVAQLRRFQRVDLGLAAYNAGPGRVERAGNEVPQIVETQLYVVRVLERWKALLELAEPVQGSAT